MKTFLNKIIFACLAATVLYGCDDRELVTVENTSSPMVMDLSSRELFLDSNFPDNPALIVTWSSAEYSIPVAINYTVEASADEAFTSPYEISKVTESNRTATYNVSQVNTAAQGIGLTANEKGNMFIRVKSYLGNGSLLSVSNVTSLKVTPYKLVYPDFFLVGEAAYMGWTATSALPFYKTDNFSYVYTYLENGKNFRFLGQQDWNPINYSIDADGIKDAYKYFKQVSSNIEKAPDDTNGENMKFTGATGIYKVTINADKDVKSLTAVASVIPNYDIPNLYIVGNVAGNGWSAETAVELTRKSAGVFELITPLMSDSEFKFLGQKSFGALEWGNIIKDNAGNSGFLGPKDDNGNIKFAGDGGSYKITVNIKAGLYTIVKQ